MRISINLASAVGASPIDATVEALAENARRGFPAVST
jgi:hypothetical protein